jgi:hypothetical protein
MEVKAGWAEAAGWRAVKAETEATWAEVGWAWAAAGSASAAKTPSVPPHQRRLAAVERTRVR